MARIMGWGWTLDGESVSRSGKDYGVGLDT